MLKKYFANKNLLFASVTLLQCICGFVEGSNWEEYLEINGHDISREDFFKVVNGEDFDDLIEKNRAKSPAPISKMTECKTVTEKNIEKNRTKSPAPTLKIIECKTVTKKNAVSLKALPQKSTHQTEKKENEIEDLTLSKEFQFELEYWDKAAEDRKFIDLSRQVILKVKKLDNLMDRGHRYLESNLQNIGTLSEIVTNLQKTCKDLHELVEMIENKIKELKHARALFTDTKFILYIVSEYIKLKERLLQGDIHEICGISEVLETRLRGKLYEAEFRQGTTSLFELTIKLIYAGLAQRKLLDVKNRNLEAFNIDMRAMKLLGNSLIWLSETEKFNKCATYTQSKKRIRFFQREIMKIIAKINKLLQAGIINIIATNEQIKIKMKELEDVQQNILKEKNKQKTVKEIPIMQAPNSDPILFELNRFLGLFYKVINQDFNPRMLQLIYKHNN